MKPEPLMGLALLERAAGLRMKSRIAGVGSLSGKPRRHQEKTAESCLPSPVQFTARRFRSRESPLNLTLDLAGVHLVASFLYDATS